MDGAHAFLFVFQSCQVRAIAVTMPHPTLGLEHGSRPAECTDHATGMITAVDRVRPCPLPCSEGGHTEAEADLQTGRDMSHVVTVSGAVLSTPRRGQ